MSFDFIENGYYSTIINVCSRDGVKDLRTFRVTNVLRTMQPYKYASIRNF